jgi:hypothetical protein
MVAQAFALMQQYITDIEFFRVAGAMPAPFQLTREGIQGRFDLVAEYDVRDLDVELLGQTPRRDHPPGCSPRRGRHD